MRLDDRARDWLVGGAFLVIVGGLVAVGWMNRAPVVQVGEGDPAPALDLPRLDGGSMSLGELRGRVVLLNIWATWCAPCVKEMPSMQRVYEEYRDEGLEIMAVAVDDQPGIRQADGRVEGVVSEFVDRLGLTFPVVLDPTGQTEARFAADYLPTTLLIDREGRIHAREVGGRFWDEEPYRDMVVSLLRED